MIKTQNTDNTKCCKGFKSNRNFHSLLVEIKNGTGYLEDRLALCYKTYILYILSQKILLDFYVMILKMYDHIKICIQMFVPISYIIVKS